MLLAPHTPTSRPHSFFACQTPKDAIRDITAIKKLPQKPEAFKLLIELAAI